MRIEKKAWPEYFEKVLSGEKTFDLRLADWDCMPGDTLVLREWNPKKEAYTGRTIEKEVAYVMKTKDVELFPPADVEKYGYQVLALQDPENMLASALEEFDPSELEVEKDEQEKKEGQSSASNTTTISFAIGGIVLGVAIGAGAMALTPENACIDPNTPTNVPTTTPTTTSTTPPPRPTPTGTPRTNATPTATSAPATTTATAATSTQATSTATTTPTPSADGTVQ